MRRIDSMDPDLPDKATPVENTRKYMKDLLALQGQAS
jgi:hypothetical protein